MVGRQEADQRTDEREGTGAAVKRRGILAAAAAVVAGLAAKQTSQPVAAGGTEGGALILGDSNTATTDTSLLRSPDPAGGYPQYGFLVNNDSGYTGLRGDARNLGVFGYAFVPSSAGVYGYNGNAAGTGVVGLSAGGGVVGNGSDPQNPGGNGFGVYGTSAGTHGVVGVTTAATAYSVYGHTGASGAIGVVGVADTAGSHAAAFVGPVTVNGAFTVFGGPKSAAVPHAADGTYRLLYCEESTESWFADYGKGKFVNGKAEVRLDADFAALVHTDDYHVFLTENGGTHNHLSVENQTATGFTVTADAEVAALKGKKASDLSGTFSYRVVARRKDIEGKRLATWVPPKLDTTPPKAPALPARTP